MVAGFIGVVGFIRVPWGVPSWSWGSSGVAGFIGVRHMGGLGHPGSLGYFESALFFVGFIRCCLIHWGAPLGA